MAPPKHPAQYLSHAGLEQEPGVEVHSGLSPAASFYKTANPQGLGSQAHIHPTVSHPDHSPPPQDTPGREGLKGGEGWPLEGIGRLK